MEDWLKCQIRPLVKYRQNQNKTYLYLVRLMIMSFSGRHLWCVKPNETRTILKSHSVPIIQKYCQCNVRKEYLYTHNLKKNHRKSSPNPNYRHKYNQLYISTKHEPRSLHYFRYLGIRRKKLHILFKCDTF